MLSANSYKLSKLDVYEDPVSHIRSHMCKDGNHNWRDSPLVMTICDWISYNKASTHTKSNLRFYQKWIAGLTHYHIPHCTSFRTGKSGFCSSFLPTLSKPRVGDWRH